LPSTPTPQLIDSSSSNHHPKHIYLIMEAFECFKFIDSFTLFMIFVKTLRLKLISFYS
jgi:hypothetical protein